jgi:pimeloyl-ACP methyl ester carboxylesterase
MHVRPLDIRVADSTLRDLRARLTTTRLPPDDASDWEAGTSPAYMRELVDYWRTDFDWRARETELLRFRHYTAAISGTTVHFVHERGKGDNPLPIVLTHGFPDSFYRFHALIPLLADPAAHGGDASDAFHVVVPSIPGYAFSTPSDNRSDLFHLADRWHDLMTGLGYEKFGAHGGDFGALVTEHLARSYADALVGIHLTDVPYWHSMRKPRKHTDAEAAYFAAIDTFQREQGAYTMIQGNRPQTLADGLNDSPAGLAAWIVSFFERWSDCDGDLESVFSKDELLTNVMLYWVTQSVGPSFSPYYDVLHAGAGRWMLEVAKHKAGGTKKVPAGFAMFPKDLANAPREWAERFFDVQRWSEMSHGGHFAAMEQPELLAEEIRAFFRPLRVGRSK